MGILTAEPARAELRELAGRALAAFGRSGRATLLNHTINSTFRVDGAGGRLALRLYRRGVYDAAAVASEIAWLEHLDTAGTGALGCAVPAPVRTPDGAPLVLVDEVPAALFSWLDGASRSAWTPARARRVGEALACLHLAETSFSPVGDFTRPRFDLDRLLGADAVIEPGAATDFLSRPDREFLDRTAAELRQELAPLTAPGATAAVWGLIHGDLTPKNCLFPAGADAAAAPRILDFADFGHGFRAYDIAVSLLRFGEDENGRPVPALREAFLAGYEAARPIAAAEHRALAPFLACREIFLLRLLASFLELPVIRDRGREGFPYLVARIRQRRGERTASRGRSGAGESLAEMSTVRFLSDLQKKDVHLRLDGEKMRLDAPKGALDNALKTELKKRKSELVDFLRRAAGRAAGGPPVISVPRDRPLPLSFAQERLWFFDHYQPGQAAYNMSTLLWLDGPLGSGALERALGEIVRRHEILRTTFRATADGPVQVIAPPPVTRLPVVDLHRLPALRAAFVARRLARRLGRRPFDLERGPLLRFALLRLAPARHLFVFIIHHIVFDGWSSGVVTRELLTLYDAAPLPELGIQYADFARWQRRYLVGEELERQLDYWRHATAGAPGVLALPTDRPRPQEPAHDGGKVARVLPAALAEEIEKLCRREGTTPFMVLAPVFGLLLGRAAGQDDLLLGTPIANRNRTELEGLIGFFANTLVLRLRPAGDLTGREYLEASRRTIVGAYEHQDLPFEKLVEELRPERAGVTNPLVQVMLALQNAPAPAPRRAGLEMRAEPAESGQVVFDLIANLRHLDAFEGGGLSLTLRYPRALFDATTMIRLAARFELLLGALAAAPDRCLSSLPILTPGEHHQLLRELDDVTRHTPDGALSLPVLFARQAERHGAAPAVVYGDSSLSYGELLERSRRLAARLRARLPEARRGAARVGLCLERSPRMIVAMLAVLETGAAYVPLDLDYPAERLRFMLEDAGVAVVLVEPATRHLVPAPSMIEILDLEEEASEILSRPLAPAAPRGAADHPAYVIYTSGSTGRPKGVLVPQRAIRRLVRATNYVDLGPGDRVAQISNASFDAATFEIWGPLLNGAAVVGTAAETVLEPAVFAAWIRDARITHMFLTTALFIQTARQEPGAFSGLDTLLTGGEAMDPGWVRAVLEAGAPRRLMNVYGPTEATTFATFHPIARLSRGTRNVPIGGPIANTTLRVLDTEFRAVPLGVAGELAIGGEGLARGYLGRPRLSAERFVPDPYAPQRGERLYRSGDLVRRRHDGAVEFLGRFDHQVKLRGFRVELGEIESALVAHPWVSAAVVLMRGGSGEPGEEDRRLIAWLAGPAPSAAELRAFLAERLPPYMVPAAFVQLAEWPLTPNGKIDHAALPDPDETSSPGAAKEPAEAADPLEEIIAGIWAAVLELSRVGRNDDFFELGGHSLLATRIVSRVREVLDVEFPLAQLFAAPTVAAMAEHARMKRRARHGVAVPPIRPRGADAGSAAAAEGLELSFAQERLWLIERLEWRSPVYNVASALHLRGDLRAAVLERAFAEVTRRHEAMRTSFVEVDGQPRQSIVTDARPELPDVDLRVLPAPYRRERAQRLAEREARRLFDLREAPLLRLRLLRLEDREWVLLVVLHHIVADGWSVGVLVREVTTLYRAFLAGRPSPLPELAVQYADYAHWQRRYLDGEVLERQLAHWRERLAGVPPRLEWPHDRPRTGSARFRGRQLPITFDAALSRALNELSRRHGATLFMTLLASFQGLLGRYSGQHGVAVGSPIAGRHHAEIEDLIGFFVNTLVLYVKLADDPSFDTLLARARRAALDAYAYQDLPFERLVEELAPRRDLDSSPLFQVMLALQNAPQGRLELPGLEVESLPAGTGTVKFDFIVSLAESASAESPAGLRGSLNYRSDLFDATTMARFLAHWKTFLRAAAEDPERRLGEIPLLSAAERHQLTREWSSTVAPPPFADGDTLAALVAASCARHGEAVAVIHGDDHLSFAELLRRARRLAARLQSAGAAPETPVAVLLERSAELITGFCAVLFAGAPWLPLDSADPPERLTSLLEDSGARVLLGHPAKVPVGVLQAGRLTIVDPAAAEASASPLSQGERGGGGDLAYVIYTSGSTGRPKGVMVEHRSLLSYLAWADRELIGPADDPPPLLTNVVFDASLKQLFVPLLRGRPVRVVDGGAVARPAALARALEEAGTTTLNCVPSLWEAVLDTVEAGEAPAPLGLRRLFLGGEAIRPELLARCRALFSGLEIVNLYGPTEATANATWSRLDANGETRPAIGRPLFGYRIHVIDRGLRPVPIGVVGELVIGGVGVTRGYLGRPRQTAERFVPSPFGARPGGAPGERLYRSGDLARHRADGELEFFGRRDDQIKLRGFRVELGEIESALLAHAAVREAVVLAPQIGAGGCAAGGRFLIAHLASSGADEADLRGHLRHLLPGHMIPARFVFHEALPRLASGKPDRTALGALPLPEEAVEIPPRDALEEALAEIFAALLGRERVGVRQPFFELGGHSLLAVRLLARIRHRFGCELPLAALFEEGTVAHLAAELRRRGADRSPATRERRQRPALVALRSGGSMTPFFAVHPVGGEVLCYADLVRRLDAERPFYGLQTPLRDGAPCQAEIEDMARHYADAVIDAAPGSVPLYLGGWSTGGLVAFAMARELAARRRRVERLVVLDALAPGTLPEEPEEDGEGHLVRAFFRDLVSILGIEADGAGLEDGAADAGDLFAPIAEHLPADFDAAELERHFAVYRLNRAAARRYRPTPWRGALTLVVARETTRGRAADLGWGAYAATVEVHEAAGDHYSMLREPYAGDLVRLLEKLLGD